ncbi:MAG TPA: plastocyanin/azurin family copper-binding protein [Solirubrobacteraceae bacterium]|nr:plastocyanin/azurin family copper-binding protein [Solirubrobacteraceae bacterium]
MTQKPAAIRSRSISKAAPAALLVGVLLLAGCGGDSYSSSSSETKSTPAAAPTTSTTSSTPAAGAGGGQKLSLAANTEGQLAYDTKSLSAKAGAVTIDFTNSSPVGHDVAVASDSGATVGATPTFQGGSKTLELNLKPGTYTFYCTVPGHRAAGMEGTLTVK